MQGSYSIKYVLPALIPELSYKDLEINEGGLASIAFESLYYETDLMRIADIRTLLCSNTVNWILLQWLNYLKN